MHKWTVDTTLAKAASPAATAALAQQAGDVVQLLQDELLRLLHLVDLPLVHLERVPVPARAPQRCASGEPARWASAL